MESDRVRQRKGILSREDFIHVTKPFSFGNIMVLCTSLCVSLLKGYKDTSCCKRISSRELNVCVRSKVIGLNTLLIDLFTTNLHNSVLLFCRIEQKIGPKF